MNWDVLFLDTTANKYYDRMTLEKEALGGTEATIIRVAEGLASLGLKVAVMQSRVDYFEPIFGQHCFFVHADDAPKMTTKHFVQIRGVGNSHMFPGSKKYVWLHDLATEKIASWEPTLLENKAAVITVSQWHKENIQQFLPNYKDISFIYNPVPEELYQPHDSTYDPNLLLWVASPHKGLGKALDLFKILHRVNPKFQLLVFNPGYLAIDAVKLSTQPGLNIYGPSPCKTVWHTMKKALCVFYPTEWDETFGCIASEANALGTPIATYNRAALSEVVSPDNDLVEQGNEDGICNLVMEWHLGKRPVVKGRDEFKFNNVIMQWVLLLAR